MQLGQCVFFKAHGSVHRNSILIKIQQDATVNSLIYFTTKSLYTFRVSQHPSPGVLKTITAACGTGQNISTATSVQGVPTWPRWSEVAVLIL